MLRDLLKRRVNRLSAPPMGGKDIPISPFNPAWLTELGIEPKVIVDAGSYDGTDALRFKEAFPAARVVTIEADPERAAIVSKAVSGSGVEFNHAAVGAKDEARSFFPATIGGKRDAQGSLFQQTRRLNDRFPQVKQSTVPISVPGKRLSTICADLGISAVDLLHMDVQGAEYEVLSGMDPIRPRAIFLETVDNGWLGASPVVGMEWKLNDLGYELVVELKGDRLYVQR